MKLKSFSNSFLGTFLFSAMLLCLVGISAGDVKAQAMSRITVDKTFCQSIGANNVCNGRMQFNGSVDFDVFAGTATTGTPITTINVVIREGNNSSGSTTTPDMFLTGGQFTVCERVPGGFRSVPRPDNSTGGSNQTATPNTTNCITGNLVSGNNVFQFLNGPAIGPTAAPASVSGRVRDENGKGVAFVLVTAVNLSTGESLQAQTDIRGRYRFEDLPTAEDYLVTASSRRYTFTPNNRVISLLEDIVGLDFAATQRWNWLR